MNEQEKMQFIQAMMDLKACAAQLQAALHELERAIQRLLEITVLEL